MIIKSLDALTGIICEISGGKASKDIIDIYPNIKKKLLLILTLMNVMHS